MPDDDTPVDIGSAIDTSRKPIFQRLDADGNVQVVSSAAGDTTQTVTVTGRKPSGAVISEGKTLTGLTPVPMTVETTWERLLKGIKSATAAGDVAIEAVTAKHSGTAAAGGADTITLDAGASAVNGFYVRYLIRITGGTGAGQINAFIAYDGATKIGTMANAWATVPDNTSVFKISAGMLFDKAPSEIMECRQVCYATVADVPGGSARTYYEKIFIKNTNGTKALLAATVLQFADPSGNFTFGLAATKNDSGTNGATNNRQVAPGGITFDDANKAVPTDQLDPGDAIGGWLEESLPAGAAAAKTSFSPQITGNSS